MENFKKLGIIEPILQAIKEKSFEEPSEIQIKSIPLVLEGKDVVAGSATGSGKTLAFGAGLIQYCTRGKGIQALVLTPTRELAEQITTNLVFFSKFKPLNVVQVYGGVSINPQMNRLRTADIVVGTPGRILDHLERNTVNFSKVKMLVLDEADRMFDMGFKDDVVKIISQCQKERQTLLFSATINQDVIKIGQKYMKNPVKISAETYVDPSKLTQVYYDLDNGIKFSLLVHLLKEEKKGTVMVFCNSRREVDVVAMNLKEQGVDALAIHGGFTQERRNKVIEQFQTEEVHVLVCTDVAARGLDIPGVSHIYNYDIPKESKQYIHRIGRTARAGKEGKAINLLTNRDHDNFSRVLRDNDVNITKEEKPYIKRVQLKIPPRTQRRFGGGNRGGPRRGFSRGPKRRHHR
ncbi:MAG: DEAD/DEAH box helicase [Candidatus Woesearchaeota archaeon]|jgi:ATP-dependent RNA helicase DeaD|nr:DEAD/DEAH box helicase [Candidatus Woesearchaeota archaeon]MDP7457190.1 DEAD/DEAH box helicase [Candidatus Woesearchaeota archaeon]